MPKLAPLDLILPKGFNMKILQILAPPSLRLGLIKSPQKYNTYIVNIQYKCRSIGECNSYTVNWTYKYWQYLAILEPINPMLHYLYSLKEVFTMKTTKKIMLTSKWQIPRYNGYGMGNMFIYHNEKSLCPMYYVKFHAIW